MPTPRHQQDLLQRLNESFRHGTPELRKALSSNSLQKSPTIKDMDQKRNQNSNSGGGEGNGQNKKKKKKNNGQGGQNNSEAGSSSTTEAPKTDKKTKRKLELASTCSIHGLDCGHNDLTCFDDPTLEANQKKIEANRANPKMKRHFHDLDFAAKKRKSEN